MRRNLRIAAAAAAVVLAVVGTIVAPAQVLLNP